MIAVFGRIFCLDFLGFTVFICSVCFGLRVFKVPRVVGVCRDFTVVRLPVSKGFRVIRV